MDNFAPITDILNRIERRVEESHGDVLNALFDHIDHKLQLMEAKAEKCSYAGALCDYVGFKITAHHMRNHIDDMYVVKSTEIEQLRERLFDYERRARIVRTGMYTNVCRTCELCKTRRKAWPRHTHFKDEPPDIIVDIETDEGPVFFRNGEKMVFSGVAALMKHQAEVAGQSCPRKFYWPVGLGKGVGG